MALARSAGCGSGRRVWDDLTPDVDQVPCDVYACSGAGAGECEYDGGESDGTGQRWSRDGISQSGTVRQRRIEDGGVVDGVVVSDCDLLGVLEILSERAVAEAVMGRR